MSDTSLVKENGFNPEEFLTTSHFKIPVEFKETQIHKGTTPPTRRILVEYQFDDDLADLIGKGKEFEVDVEVESEVEDSENPGQMKLQKQTVKETRTRTLTINEQLMLLVVGIEGVTQLTEERWKTVPFKYRRAIIDAIMADIYPNAKTSTG